MTVFMAFVGMIVFTISLFTVGFKSAWKRLWALILTGLAVDLFIIAMSVFVSLALN